MKTVLQTLLLSCLLLPPAHAEETRMSLRQEGNILAVEGQLEVSAGLDAAWAVLTDYPRFPEFVPGITYNRVLEQRKELKLIEQRGLINTGQFRMPFQGVLQVEERKRDGKPDGMKILYVSGPLKDVQGEWNIRHGKPLGLSYRMRMDISKAPFPPPLSVTIIEQQVRSWVEAFAREIQDVKRKKE